MQPDSLSAVHRILLIVAAAILFPSVILVGWLFREISVNQVKTVEMGTQQAADLIVLTADTRAYSDLTALRVLSTAQYFADGDFAGAANRAGDLLDLIPGWKAVILREADSGKVYFTVNAQGSTTIAGEQLLSANDDHQNGFGNVARDGLVCPCVSLQVVVRDRPNLA